MLTPNDRIPFAPGTFDAPEPTEFQCDCGDPDCTEIVDCEGAISEKCEREIADCAPPKD